MLSVVHAGVGVVVVGVVELMAVMTWVVGDENGAKDKVIAFEGWVTVVEDGVIVVEPVVIVVESVG